MRASDLPEFIATENFDARSMTIRTVKIQKTTAQHVQEVAEALECSNADAMRYVLECGIAALVAAGSL